MIKYITTLIIACTSVSGIAQINVKHIKKDISYLASDKLKGRGTSSAEEKIAATYIASSFKKKWFSAKGKRLLFI